MPSGVRLPDEQRAEIIERFELGEKQDDIAKAFGVSKSLVQNIVRETNSQKRAPNGRRGGKSTPATAMKEFIKRARSILWRQDGKEKKTYEKWQALVNELQEDGGCTREQAIVQASKEQPCLRRLFREFDIGDYDPKPGSHPDIYQPAPVQLDGIKSEGKELSFRENLTWAIEAAGKYLRTNKKPKTCPNDSAYFLFKQANEQPKEFLGKFAQIEGKGGNKAEEDRMTRQSGKRSIEDIEAMLDTLIEE